MSSTKTRRLLTVTVALALTAVCATEASAWCTRNPNGTVAPASTLGVSGAAFTEKNSVTGVVEPRFLGMLSYFGATRPGHTAYATLFASLCDLGFSGVRIFADFWMDGRYCGPQPYQEATGGYLSESQAVIKRDGSLNRLPAGQSPLDRLKAVLTAARNAGLVVDLSFGHEVVYQRSIQAHITGITNLGVELAGQAYDHVMFDVQNEWNSVGCPRADLSPYIPSLIAAGKAGNANRVVLASIGGEDGGQLVRSFTYALPGQPGYVPPGSGGRALAPHDSRGAGWQSTPLWSNLASAIMNPAYGFPGGTRVPLYAQEPNCIVYGSTSTCSATDNLGFYQSARNAKVTGAAAWTFHTEKLFFPSNTYPYATGATNYGASGYWHPEEWEFLGMTGVYHDMWQAMFDDCWGLTAPAGWFPQQCMG